MISVLSPYDLRIISVPAPDQLRINSVAMDPEKAWFGYGADTEQATRTTALFVLYHAADVLADDIKL